MTDSNAMRMTPIARDALLYMCAFDIVDGRRRSWDLVTWWRALNIKYLRRDKFQYTLSVVWWQSTWAKSIAMYRFSNQLGQRLGIRIRVSGNQPNGFFGQYSVCVCGIWPLHHYDHVAVPLLASHNQNVYMKRTEETLSAHFVFSSCAVHIPFELIQSDSSGHVD